MKLTLSAPSRLHLGFFDLSHEGERSYGGFGVALATPMLRVAASKSEDINVSGDASGVFESYARKFINAFKISGGVEIQVAESIPRHVGLGSGTQAALAVGTLVSKLYKIKAGPQEIAGKLGRGKVSGIGVGVFSSGGLVVDGGHRHGDESPPPILISKKFPEDWSFIVVVPDAGEGVSGVTERQIMSGVESDADTSARLSKIFLMHVLPALEEGDIQTFGRTLTEIDLLVGKLFEKVQGGIYSRESSADLVEFMLSSGVYGAGQSSWGPTVYGLVDEANSFIAGKVRDFMRENGIGGRVYLSGVDNAGAVLEEF
jgi:beta-ribofuranosylaminobenzene 5'-phosphate synthase